VKLWWLMRKTTHLPMLDPLNRIPGNRQDFVTGRGQTAAESLAWAGLPGVRRSGKYWTRRAVT
jgi:hypothetical protein